MRTWMRVFASTRACALSMVPASLTLLARGLAGLLLQDFADETESLQFVRVRRTDAANLGGRLADLLLVDAGHDDVRDVLGLRVRSDGYLDALGHRKRDLVREPDAEHDVVPLDLGLEADADEVDLPLEAVRHAEDRVLKERAVQSVESLVLLLLAAAHEAQETVLLLDGHARENRRHDGALRPLDRDGRARDLDVHSLGNGDGFLTDSRHLRSSPHRADDFAADAALLRVVAGEEALRGGDDGDAEAAEDLGKLVLPRVEAPAGLARPRQPVDDRVPRVVVLQVEPQQASAPVVHDLEVLDVTLVLEDAGQLDLEARRRDVGLLVPGGQRVSEAREEIGDGIADVHRPLLTTTPSSLRARSPRARGSGSRCGTGRTSGETPADARSACSGFACGSRTSISNSP